MGVNSAVWFLKNLLSYGMRSPENRKICLFFFFFFLIRAMKNNSGLPG